MDKTTHLKNNEFKMQDGLFIGRKISDLPNKYHLNFKHYLFLDESEEINLLSNNNFTRSQTLKLHSIVDDTIQYNSIVLMNLNREEYESDPIRSWTNQLKPDGLLLVFYKGTTFSVDACLDTLVRPNYSFTKLEKINIGDSAYFKITIKKDMLKYQNLMSKYYFHINQQISTLNGKT